MNKHERIQAAIDGQPVDAIPSGFWLHFPEESFFGRAAVEAHVDFYKATDVDVLKVMNEHLDWGMPQVSTPADWSKWKPLRVSGSRLQDQVDVVKALADRIGDEVPLIATIHGAFAAAYNASVGPGETLTGDHALTRHLREDPEAVAPALDAVADTLIELSLACLEAGAAGIYYAALGAESYRFDEKTFVNHLKPFDLKVLDALAGKGWLFLHMCKDRLRLPLYREYPGDVVNWAVHDCEFSLADGRSLFGRTVLGGLDDRSGVLVDGTDAEITAEVRKATASIGRTSFILGADCTLPTEIPLRRIRAAVDAVRAL